MTRVLVVDDDRQLQRAIRVGLSARGYDVRTTAGGQDALDVLGTEEVDLVLLDLGLPDLDGDEVIRRLRSWSKVPVIVLSVRDAQKDKVAALDAGADDYVTKPFATDELLARVRAVLRRAGAEEPGSPTLAFAGRLRVDLARRLVELDGEGVHLTPTEYRLLEAMITNPGKLLTHQWLLRRVWGPGYGTESHYLRLYVRQLRQKLADDPGEPYWITTEPGLGYRWIADPDPSDAT